MAESTAAHLDALQTLIQQAKAVPMSASCMLNRAEVLGVIEATQASLADELAAAKAAANASPPAIERAEVCIMVVDASEPLTDQDLRILNNIEEAGRALVIAFNKQYLNARGPLA